LLPKLVVNPDRGAAVETFEQHSLEPLPVCLLLRLADQFADVLARSRVSALFELGFDEGLHGLRK